MVNYLTMLALIIALLVCQATSSNFECPAVNNLVVQDDYGVQYVVSCGTDADPGAYSSSGVFNNWNECFQACSTHSIDASGAGGPCNGFTYAGALNGKGGGTCYFKSGNMRFVGSGSGLISVATPERCPGCNIAGYANGTSPRSSSVAGVQTVSVTYTTIQTRTETATRFSTNTITTTGTVTTTAISSYYTTATTTAVSTSRETLTTTTVQTTTQPASTVTSVSTYSTTTVITYTSVVPASTRTNTRTQTELTTVTYVSTQPTTVVSTYISTQPASTNTATITQRTTLISTYQTSSVVTQTQTSTAPGIHGRANTDTTNHSPRDQRGTRSYTDGYISAACIHDRANTDTTDHCPRDQRSTRSHTDDYIDPAHDLCLDFHDLFSIYDDIARCDHYNYFLGNIDYEYHDRVHNYNYNPADSDSTWNDRPRDNDATWHDHPGDNDTAWRNSRLNLGPNHFRTYGHLHYSQHQLRRRVCDLCDPNSCVCPNVEQLRVSAFVFGINSIGLFSGFSYINRRLVWAASDVILAFLEFLH
ncbi:hypothetical protein KC356_g2222 [Hortaea werneckii]|nr:hypothetical protein KC356_g2222 [Hortaea werneckii]